MALEDSVLRLARAIESQGEAAAVKEVIRQRDQALRDLAAMMSDRDWEQKARISAQEYSDKKSRRIASLQGVITRMKRQRVGGGHADSRV